MISPARAYALLNVHPASSLEEVKQAYRRAARLYHPDTKTGLSDAGRFHQIVQAYNTIKAERKRRGKFGSGAAPTVEERSQWGGWFAIRAFLKRSTERFLRLIKGSSNGRERRHGSTGSRARNASREADRRWSPVSELIRRFDAAGSVADQALLAREIFIKNPPMFERMAIDRLAKVNERTRAELIKILGELGSRAALEAAAGHLLSPSRHVCLAAYLALDGAGEAGQYPPLRRPLAPFAGIGRRPRQPDGVSDQPPASLFGALSSRTKRRRLSL
ncbi:MAG: DnaJ domain-containing protein [Nitrospinae bacterium]|nr:DnaJ domain-containing protein [Nitrospinota bacterium]